MKKLLPLLSVLFLISRGSGQQIIQEITEKHNDGSIKSITYYKETRNKIEKSKELFYFENGQKKEELTVKNNSRQGSYTGWYENGQKRFQGTYKDDKDDGLYTTWYENGQKRFQGTYKDDKKVDVIGRWNEDGSVKKEPFIWE